MATGPDNCPFPGCSGASRPAREDGGSNYLEPATAIERMAEQVERRLNDGEHDQSAHHDAAGQRPGAPVRFLGSRTAWSGFICSG
jgi:hypothetical protein